MLVVGKAQALPTALYTGFPVAHRGKILPGTGGFFEAKEGHE
jgi:hypothetical protein